MAITTFLARLPQMVIQEKELSIEKAIHPNRVMLTCATNHGLSCWERPLLPVWELYKSSDNKTVIPLSCSLLYFHLAGIVPGTQWGLIRIHWNG